MDVMLSAITAGAALVAAVSVLAVSGVRREPEQLRKRAENGEILLLSFEQVMALYNSAPEKWDLQVDDPVYYPRGKEHDGLLVYMLPKERRRYRKWFDWRVSHGEDAQQFQMTAQALLSMQEDLSRHLHVLQDTNQKALDESAQAVRRVLDEREKEGM